MIGSVVFGGSYWVPSFGKLPLALRSFSEAYVLGLGFRVYGLAGCSFLHEALEATFCPHPFLRRSAPTRELK